MPVVILKKGREKSLLRKHPWVFSGAVAKFDQDVKPGQTVDVLSSKGTWLGRGAYSPASQIRVRIWSFEEEEEINDSFFEAKVQHAVHVRDSLFHCSKGNSHRLINGESDGLPGVIVDRYNNFLACQFLSAGAELWKTVIVRQLERILHPTGIFERSDLEVREKEALPKNMGLLAGQMPPDLVEIREGACRFLVDIRTGHKTGFYLDQAQNRYALAQFAGNFEILNCFAYTGAFSVSASVAGARHVTNVESSAAALHLAERNMVLNGIQTDRYSNITGDVFQVLRQYRNAGTRFDIVVLDPPKFAESAGSLKKACRGYKDINLWAIKLLRPGGLLFTFSCSGIVSRDLFQKIVADAALDAGRRLQIIQWLSQSPDHPCGIHFPEGLYLKGMVCKVQ